MLSREECPSLNSDVIMRGRLQRVTARAFPSFFGLALSGRRTLLSGLGLLLLFTTVTLVLFLAFRGTASELGALTDSAATSIAVEAGPQGMFSDNGQALTPVKVSPHEQIDPDTGSSTPHVHCGTLNSASVGQFRLNYRRGTVRTVSGSYSITGADPWPPSCGPVTVSGTGYTAYWYARRHVHYPPPDYTSVHLPELTYSSGGSISCGVTGTGRFSCGGGGSSAPTEDISPQEWRYDYWRSHSPIQVCYNGTCVTARRIISTPPKPRPPPPTPTPLADPISATLEITSSPAAHSTYAIGETVEVKLTFDEDITVQSGSEPSLKLALDSGTRTIAYDRMEGTRTLHFDYTVVEGDLDPTGLAIPENPMSGHVYVGSEKRRLVNSGLQSDPDHRVDGVRPRINRVQFDQSVFSALKAADTGYKIDLVLSFDEDVEVTGDPQVVLTVNDAAATSTFESPSGLTLNKSFRYIQPRSSDSAETSTTTRVALPAGEVSLDSNDSIKDRVGNDAILTYGALHTSSMTAFDRTGVVLEGLSISGNTNRYGWLRICKVRRDNSGHFQGCHKLNDSSNGQGFADITAQFDEAITQSAPNNAELDVTLDGGATSTTEIPLNLGTLITDAAAGRVKFKYYVKPGEDAPGGLSVAPGSLECDGGGTSCYEDSNDNPPSNLSHTGLPLQPQYRIDGIVPTITGLEMLSEAPGREGWYGINDTIRVGMRFSEPVLVGSYGPAPNASQNVFIPNFGGNLKLPLTLDTAATSTTELLRRSGDIMNEVHDFRFIVREGDNDATGIEVAANSLVRTKVGSNTGSADNNRKAVIHDIAYNHVCEGGVNNWQIQLNPGGPLGGDFEECDGGQDQHPALAAQVEHKVDGIRPVLESIEFVNTPADADGYAIGEEVRVTATFSERVWIYGEPILNLQVGGDLKAIAYHPLTGTNASGTIEYLSSESLTFVYVVDEGDEDTDGLSIPQNAFNKLSALIDDVARNEVLDADIAHEAVTTDETRKVDGIRATITGARFVSTPTATSSSADTYIGGDEIAVEVTFSEPVDTYPDGALMDLEMTLADMSTTTLQMQADGVTSTTTVVFRYTVTDQDLGTGLKVPEDPFGTPISDLLDQVTATTTLDDLLVNSPVALNIVDGVSFINFISI